MILFRADGNSKIGTGHIMRCLSIADELRIVEREIVFILADNSMASVIENRGYKVIILNSDYQNLINELDQLINIINTEKPSTIILDSYYVTMTYLEHLRKLTRTVYIDDIASFPYPVDLLVNYNIYAFEMNYDNLYKNVDDKPTILLGPSFIPLRAMFRNLERHKQKEKVQDVLISTGGSDSLHISLSLLRNILKCNDMLYRYHFLLGALNKDKEEIYNLSDKQSNIILHENVTDMKSLISSMDIVVSAAGSTLYEICACGVPMITYVLADNQISGANSFNNMGLAINIGDLRNKSGKLDIDCELNMDSVEAIIKTINELANNYKLRCEMSAEMQKIVDGLGAERISYKIVNMIDKN